MWFKLIEVLNLQGLDNDCYGSISMINGIIPHWYLTLPPLPILDPPLFNQFETL